MKYLVPAMLLPIYAHADVSSTIDQIISWIPTSPAVITSIVVVMELILRFIPSEQPLSILYGVATVVKKVAQLFDAVGVFLDKIVGQVTKK